MNQSNPLVSITIPCYEMHGKGEIFLNESLSRVESQTYKKIQVVISDHSLDNTIENVFFSWKDKISIKYIKNSNNIGSSSSNVNCAINNSDGEIIKILFQDDYLYHENSLKDIVNNFGDENSWLVTACIHTTDGLSYYNEHYPKYNDKIYLGINTISSPSVLSIKKTVIERFDEDLIWLMDCDIYKKLYDKYGNPIIVNEINVVNRLWGSRLSDTIANEIKINEVQKVKNKYEKN